MLGTHAPFVLRFELYGIDATSGSIPPEHSMPSVNRKFVKAASDLSAPLLAFCYPVGSF